MKNKKILAIILSFTMMIGSLPMSVFADESEETVSEDHQEVTEIQEDIPEEEPEIPEPEIVSTDEAALYDSGDAGSGYVVTTWAELKEALAAVPLNNENTLITLAADITAGSMIEIKPGMNVSLHLDGYTLSRDINSQDADGHVIIVKSGAVLDIYGSSAERGWGTITGGFANNGGGINNKGILDVAYVDIINNNTGDTAADDSTHGGGIWNSGELTLGACKISGNKADDGGGIYNAAGGTIILNDISITGNTSILHGGGGIVNYGTITFEASNTITGNTSKSNGGGVWNDGMFKLSGSDNKLVIKNNTSTSFPADNLFLNWDKVMTLTSDAALSSDTDIYVSTQKLPRAITSGWKNGSSQTMVKAEGSMELDFGNNELRGSVSYVEKSWDSSTKKVVSEKKKVQDSDLIDLGTLIPDENGVIVLSGGKYYYITNHMVIYNRLEINYDAKLILPDWWTLTCNKGIRVDAGATLNIYAQSGGTGILTVLDGGSDGNAGIGGNDDCAHGNIYIHGGTIQSTGSTDGAGIGSGDEAPVMASGSIKIFAGTITANGGGYAAGIGGGDGSSGGPVTIYGGTVNATGGKQAAGIGSGEESDSNSITIYGGKITAKGSDSGNDGSLDGGAGIGTGELGNVCAPIRIYGGEVNADGGKGGAGIGSGSGQNAWSSVTASGTIEISGGQVTARGGRRSAGIGGGDTYNSNHTIRISGGTVLAYASIATVGSLEDNGAAGIGGGACGSFSGADFGGTLEITGGTVKAYGSGRDTGDSDLGAAGIGGGLGGDMTGTITISGGSVEAVSRLGGAGIGGGASDGSRGSDMEGTVTINGTAEVRVKQIYNSVAYDKVQTIGHGYYKITVGDPDQGTLILGNNMMVYFDGEAIINAGMRDLLCRASRKDQWLYIRPCIHPAHVYVVSESGHLMACPHCSTTFQTEAHQPDSQNKCTVCGYQGALYDISFDGNGGSGSMDTVHVVPGSEYVLPGSSFTPPEDKVFTGWTVGSGTDVKVPGDKITVDSDTVLTANYEYFATLAGYTLSLDGDISIKFYMRVADPGADDPYMEFTVPGASEEYSTQKVYLSDAGTEVVDNVTYRVFTCHVEAKEMAQPVMAQMHWGDKTSSEYTYSVKEYAEFILANADKSDTYKKAESLVKAMLNYGTEAQKYFGKSAPYANDTDYMNDDDRTVVPLSADSIIAEQAVIPDMQGVTFEGASLSLKSETTLSLYFKSKTALEFVCAEKSDIETFTSGGYQILRIRGIMADELDELMTVTVTCGGQSYTIKYSALNYCKNVLGGNHPDLVNVVSALYKYREEAEAYKLKA